MMYLESEDDLRQWILDGRPKRLAESPAGPEALLKMPAYRDLVSDAELDDLVAWYRAVAEYEEVPADAAAGREVARRAGCFGCHGPGGRIGASNPGALKAYIPGWGGDDFFDLVRSEAELREWILDGVASRLADHPVAARLRERQVIQMPAYRDVLAPADVDAMVSYIRWVSGGW
jgi:mono/diheme cytochrome c family protein